MADGSGVPSTTARLTSAATTRARPRRAADSWLLKAGGAIARLAREHRGLTLLLALAALIRFVVALGYRPALFFNDSWAYLGLAANATPAAIAFDRPSGYAFLIEAFSIGGTHFAALTAVQHLAGLAVGVLAYALLLRLGTPRRLALAAAAVVLLDGYAIGIEQFLLPEAFFTLALVASAFLAIAPGRDPVALAASGALLGAAATMRTIALFAIPVWAIYVIWMYGDRRTVAAAALGLALPLMGYASFHAASGGGVGFTQAEGWFLAARVGEISECRGADIPRAARPLCNRRPSDSHEGASYHMWVDDSPANRVFGGLGPDQARQAYSNRVLKEFAVAIIRDRPLQYAGIVGGDFLRYFTPGVASLRDDDTSFLLPVRPTVEPQFASIRRRVAPDYAPRDYATTGVARAYQQVFHTQRWLLAGLVIAALAALGRWALTRGRVPTPHRREIFLLVGASLAMLLGSAATNEFILRYLIPTVPLLVCGGTLALLDLARTRA